MRIKSVRFIKKKCLYMSRYLTELNSIREVTTLAV